MQNKWPEYSDYNLKEMIEESFVFVPQLMLGWDF